MKRIINIIAITGILFVGFSVNNSFAQPSNDDCTGTQSVTPDGSCVNGTTIGAADNWTGLVGCQAVTGDHEDVWYSFVATGSTYVGTVTTSSPWTGDVEFTLVSSTTGCTGPFTIVGSACGASPLNININGLTVGTTYWFTISNTKNGVMGPFVVCSNNTSAPANCTDNDDCATPTPITYTTGVQTCLTDCNTGAAPGPDFGGTECYNYPYATVWYEFTAGASTASVDVELTSSDLSDPYFTVFETDDCLSYTIYDCIQGSSGSASANILIAANLTYLIAVSDANGDEGNFQLCVTVNDDNSACNTNNSLTVTATSMGSPMAGPYLPGEIVTFCYNITNWQQINCNYLEGIVPSFGDCWDPASFTANGAPVNITTPLTTAGILQTCASCPVGWNVCRGDPAGTWSWFAAGQVTYNNIVGSLPPNSPMPAGWYFLCSYSPTAGTCTGDPTDPDNSYGDGNFPNCNENTLDWNVCFQLQARASSGCASGYTDCSVTVHTYSDGELGVWNNIGCTADASGASTVVANLCCSTAPTAASPVLYCRGDAASSLTATGTSLLWYTVPTGGTGSSTAPTPSTAVAGSTNYYVSQTISGCESPRTTITVTVSAFATANANTDQTICAGSTVSLNGSYGGSATSGTWSGGSGSFSPNANTMNAIYTPSAGDIAATTVTLTLTTNDPAGPCSAAIDAMVITINTPATVNANSDQVICASSTVSLNGAFGGGAASATWSGGGTFSPNATTMNATYTPSAGEVSAGSATLTLTTNDPAGPCTAVSDQMVIAINVPATANANSDQVICAGSTVSLNGSYGGGASGATWSGGGTFLPNATTMNATYTPSAGEVAAQTATLILTSNDPVGPCNVASDQMTITINIPATVNANINQTICAGATVTLNGTYGGGATSATWSGGGTFSPNATTMNATYTPSAGEISAGSATLTLTTNDPAGPCPAFNDQMTITITPLDNASFTYASSTYCQTGTDPTATITGLGGGTFTVTAGCVLLNAATGLIDLDASTLATHTVTYTTNGPCPNISNFNITITTAPSADFSYSGPYCQGGTNPSPTFGPGASGGIFTSSAGLNFVNVNTGEINLATSTPGLYTVNNDIAAGGGCSAASANNTVTIDATATVSANTDQTICSGSNVILDGTIGGSASSGTWSGGTGTFSPGAGTLNATYIPTSADSIAGSVLLTLTTDDPLGPCTTVSDQMAIMINTPAIADANSDQIICAGSTVPLSGSVGGGASSGTWSGGTGTFSPDEYTLNAIYTPSAGEVTGGSATLILTTDDPSGPCNAATDQITITINQLATVDAGLDIDICEGSSATLAGIVGGGATSGTWSGGGGIFTPDNTTMTATYTPTPAEISTGTVTLTLVTDDPSGPCNAISDQVQINIYPVPVVDAGGDQVICDGSDVNLSGSIGGGATSATWTGGTGTYTPDANTVNAVYTPTASEISSGSLVLTLTTDEPVGPCTALSDIVTITINQVATVNAGTDIIICEGDDAVLAGLIGGAATSGSWSGGTGTFIPDNITLNATYIPSAGDISAGTITLVLATDDPSGPCFGVNDTVDITIIPADDPSFNYSSPTYCQTGADPVASITGTLGGTFSSTAGLIFTDNTTGLIDLGASTLGPYTITYTTNGSCPGSSTFDIIITLAPTAAFTYAGPYCQSGITNPAPVISPGSVAGDFSALPAGLTIDQFTGVVSLAASAAGTYWVFNNVAAASGCAAAVDSTTIVIEQPATASAGPDTNICSYETLTLSGTLGGSASFLTWTSSGDGTFSDPASATAVYTPSVNDIANGTITLTITTDDPANSCGIVSDSLVLDITLPPDITMGPDTILNCTNPSVQISCSTLSMSVNYIWSGPGIVSGGTTNTPIVDAAGTYIVTITSTMNGCFIADSLVVGTDMAIPDADAGNDTTIVCAAPSVTLNGSSLTPGVTYNWTGPGIVSGATTSSPTVNAAGTYIMVVTDPANGCTASDTVLVSPSTTPPPAEAGPDAAFCSGQSTTLNASGGIGYLWTPATGLSNNAIGNPVATPATTTMYTVQVTDSLGCTATDSVLITVNNLPSPLITGSDEACQGQTLTYSTPGITGNTYLWTVTGGTPATGTDTSLSITWGTTGSAIIIITETTAPANCVNSDTLDVTIYETPVASAGSDASVCIGGSVIISALSSTGTPPLNYLWDQSLGSGAEHTVSPLISTIYTVTVSNTYNCNSSDDVTITVLASPQFSITGIDATCMDMSDGSAQSTIITATQPVTYLWSNGLTTDELAELAVGVYHLTVIDATGCTEADSVIIASQNLEECLEIPDIFTPNDDGSNDKFEIRNIQLYPGTTVEIYYRWGNLLYTTDNYADPANWWDGKHNGKECPFGSYVYIIKIPGRDPITGVVSIVR